MDTARVSKSEEVLVTKTVTFNVYLVSKGVISGTERILLCFTH